MNVRLVKLWNGVSGLARARCRLCLHRLLVHSVDLSQKTSSQVALRRFLCWLASLLGSVPRCPPIALLRPLCQTWRLRRAMSPGPQDQIMLELENALVSFYCQTVSCDVNALLPLLSRYRLCLRLPVSNYPSSLNRSPQHLTPALTYSPTSTDSLGDRTIQMSAFEDGMFSGSQPPWTDILSASALNVCNTVSNCK